MEKKQKFRQKDKLLQTGGIWVYAQWKWEAERDGETGGNGSSGSERDGKSVVRV